MMLTDQIGGFGLGFENDLYPLLIVAAGAMLGRVPSLLAEREVLPASTSTLSLGTILAGAALGFLAVPAVGGSAFVGLLFAINLIGTHVLVSGERPEWATVLTFSSVGLLFGMVAAATAGDSGLVTKEYTFEGQTAPTLNEYREALAFVFFNVWIMFSVLGALVAVLARARLTSPARVGSVTFRTSTDLGPQQPAPSGRAARMGHRSRLSLLSSTRWSCTTDWP